MKWTPELVESLRKAKIILTCPKIPCPLSLHHTSPDNPYYAHWWVSNISPDIDVITPEREDWVWHLWSQLWSPWSFENWEEFLSLVRTLKQHDLKDGPIPEEIIALLTLR